MKTEIELKEKLNERNLRLTKPRKIILEELRKIKSHPKAHDIYLKVREKLPNVSLGTVYRNLKLFKELGLIFSLEYVGASGRYDEGSPDHSHFICENCGKVFDIEDPIDQALAQKLANNIDATLTHHRTELYGLCQACKLSTKKN
jgi:Fur family peroxide stress response transcriptional regulator